MRISCIALAIAGCPLVLGCPRPEPPAAPDPPPAVVVDCARACERLGELGCPEAETPDGGKACLVVCVDAEREGKYSLKPACVAVAHTSAELRACGTVRCRR
jgi:hypothetical protein